jgi:hypothetical protein
VRRRFGKGIRGLLVALWGVVLTAGLAGCGDGSRLDRRRAAELIKAEMERRPLVVTVGTGLSGSGTVDRKQWAELLEFLRAEGLQPVVLDEPEYYGEHYETRRGEKGWALWVELPVEASLKVDVAYAGMGRPFAQRLRYGREVQVEVTGIAQGESGKAEAEFRYEWDLDPTVQELLRRIPVVGARARERFLFLKYELLFLDAVVGRGWFVDTPLREKGAGRAELRLYDDGWRVVKLNL